MSALIESSSAASHRHGLPATLGGISEGAAFGEFLRHARERRGLTLQQIARETKIPQRHLDSLEHGDLSVIPGTTYRRGEVIAYADAVGLNRAIALAELERVSRVSASSDSGGAKTQHGPTRRGVGSVAAVALSIAGIVGLVFWRQGPTVTTSQNDVTVQSEPSPPPAVPPPASDRKETPASTTSSTVPAPAVRQDTLEARPQALGEETPAAGASAESLLVIITEPPGARVTVDGIGWGIAPLSIRNLPAGMKQIRVTKDGYVAAVSVARLIEGRSLTISIPLRSSEQ